MRSINPGSTSQLIEVFIQDSSASDGSGLTGLLYDDAGLTAYYYHSGAVAAVEITLADMTVGTWASGGFIEIDSANMPGWYQFGIPNNALLTGANAVSFLLQGAANMAPLPVQIQLSSVWDESVASHVTAGSTGATLTAARISADDAAALILSK